MTVADFRELSSAGRDKSLTVGRKRRSGRNNQGRISVYDQGGGAKRLYRFIDFKQSDHLGVEAEVLSLEYDPNRTAYIAKIVMTDGEKSYIIAPAGLKPGSRIMAKADAPIQLGNRAKMKNIPIGTQIYNIELACGRGGQIVRSAGNYAVLGGFDGKYAILRLPSAESRRVLAENYASIGSVSNSDHYNIVIGKAGRKRHMGIRPHVRGKARNPVDHPHGGGEGVNPIGLKYPKTRWGAPALGRRTRNKKKSSAKLIINRRKK